MHCKFEICFVPKKNVRNQSMKWNDISTQWIVCILTAKKRNDIDEQMLHKLCVKEEQRESERERGVRVERNRERERVIGTGW